ncbi:MAG: LON peptidase substrate-binding domain-containing protein [Steroidobacteraceae bacterium]
MRKTVEIPLFPLNAVLYPGGPLPLRIFEPRYVDMVRRCMREESTFGVVLIAAGAEAGGAVQSTAPVGTGARITDFFPLADGLLGIYCLGGRKFRLLERRQQSDGLNLGRVQWLPEEPAIELPAAYDHLGRLMRKVLPELGELYEAVEKHLDDAAWVGYRLAEILPVSLSDKQEWLELDDPLERLASIEPLIRREG